jgi:hypothetical protein
MIIPQLRKILNACRPYNAMKKSPSCELFVAFEHDWSKH